MAVKVQKDGMREVHRREVEERVIEIYEVSQYELIVETADDSAHFQKLQSLLEDVFEDSDSFSAVPNSQDLLRSTYFGSLSSQTGQPLLADKTIEKISRYVTSLQKGKRRQTSDAVEWDPVMIGTLLRLLERSMVGVDNINPFPDDKKAVATKKKKKGKKESTGSKSPELDEEEPSQEVALTDAEAQHGQQLLEAFRSAGVAAECCLTIIDTENLPKQVSSPDPEFGESSCKASIRRHCLDGCRDCQGPDGKDHHSGGRGPKRRE